MGGALVGGSVARTLKMERSGAHDDAPGHRPRRPAAALGRDWSPDTAELSAREAGIAALGDRHWKVITSCREDAARVGRAPGLQRLVELTGMSEGELSHLFPGDVPALVARIAGVSRSPRRSRARSNDDTPRKVDS